MRINNLSRENNGTPNPLFRWMGQLLTSLCEQRKPYHPRTYVEMPDLQNDLQDFTQGANQGAIGLLIGPVGIGKSTLLSHFRKTIWGGVNPICEVIPFDCAETHFASKLGKDFYNKDLESKRAIASTVALEALCFKFRNQFGNECDQIRRDLFEFIRQNQRGLIVGFVPSTPSDDDIARMLERAELLDQISYWSCVTLCCVHKRGLRHAKLIIDNVDDKDAVLIAQFLETAAQFQRKINEIASTIDRNDFRFTPILSCRPTTLHRVYQVVDADPDHNGQGWAGVHEIYFRIPCAISTALEKRYYHDLEKHKSENTVSTNAKIQLIIERDWEGKETRWTVEKDKLFVALVRSMDNTSQLEHILSLSNFNVAEAMSMTLRMLSNNRFIPVKTLAEVVKDAVEVKDTFDSRRLFSRTTAIRALAYGNQQTKIPLYPVNDTPVHNLLDGHSDQEQFSLIKLRILAILSETGNFEFLGSSANDVVSRSTLIDLLCSGMYTRHALEKTLDELFQHMLLVPREYHAIPAEISDDHGLVVLPRGDFLMKQLESDSVLLECWRDNTNLPESFSFKGRTHVFSQLASRSLPTNELAREVYSIVVLVLKTEIEEMNRLPLEKRSLLFKLSGKPLFERMLAGYRGSVERHYNRQLNQSEKSEIAEVLKVLQSFTNQADISQVLKPSGNQGE